MIRQVKYMTLLLLGLLCGSSAGAESFEVGNYQYTILDAEAKTVKVQRNPSVSATSLSAIDIDDEVEYNSVTYKITEVAGAGFSGCNKTASVLIGNNVAKIGTGAFNGCKFREVVIPASVSRIEGNAFKDCSSLRKVTIASLSALTTIESYTFDGCFRMEEITLPASVTNINANAFKGCTGLLTIICEAAAAPTKTSSAFSGASTTFAIKVYSSAAKESFVENWSIDESRVEVLPLGIAEGVNNDSILQHHNGHTANVNIGRTIRQGGYNTICLPFALTEEQVIAAFGEGCDVQELRDDSKISDEGIEINFNPVSSMEAGKPYLVKTTATEDLTPSCFVNVVLSNTVDASTTTDVDFVGVFSPTDLPAEQDVLILGEGNTLHPLSADDREISGMRGYFVLKTEQARTAAKRGVKMVVNSKEGGTDIEASAGFAPQTTKCLQNGQLHIIRNDVHYDAQGRVIQ